MFEEIPNLRGVGSIDGEAQIMLKGRDCFGMASRVGQGEAQFTISARLCRVSTNGLLEALSGLLEPDQFGIQTPKVEESLPGGIWG